MYQVNIFPRPRVRQGKLLTHSYRDLVLKGFSLCAEVSHGIHTCMFSDDHFHLNHPSVMKSLLNASF